MIISILRIFLVYSYGPGEKRLVRPVQEGSGACWEKLKIIYGVGFDMKQEYSGEGATERSGNVCVLKMANLG